MAEANLTKSANIAVSPRDIDFVSRFGYDIQALLDIIGISRPIVKQPGYVLKSRVGSVVLNSTPVGEGDLIPYSQATVREIPYAEMDIEKYVKGVTIESIKDKGYDAAVGLTDTALLHEIENKIMGSFYRYVKGGLLTSVQTSYQLALAMAKGLVVNKFKADNLSVTDVVEFVNVLDFYKYLGTASITVQSRNGIEYVKDFMGISTIILVDNTKLDSNMVIATPVENLVMYYINPADSDFARAGLNYTVAGETPLIGFHSEGNYSHAVSDSFAICGVTLFAEYLDGIAVVKYEASGSSSSITVTSAAATNTTGATKIAVTAPATIPADWTLYAKAAATAPTAPSYLGSVDNTWTRLGNAASFDDVTGFTSAHKLVVVATNGSGQVVAASAAAGVSVVVKE